MKTLFKFSCLCLILFLLISCSSNSNPNAIVILSTLEASVSPDEICTSTINFNDFNNNVYAYRADADFAVPSIQAGGHSTLDESTDLGFNMFIDPDNTNLENYTIDGASVREGTAYVFYINGGTQFISSEHNTGNLVVERLELSPSDGQVQVLIASFEEVMVINNTDPNDSLCVNNFKIKFYR